MALLNIKNRHNCRPVRCIETGERWGSLTECAASLGVSVACLGQHLRFDEPLDGLHFEKVTEQIEIY